MANQSKKSVLIIGGGAVGAIAALNLEVGGQASVTAVLRSNFKAVQESGYDIESCDHGVVKEFRPSHVYPKVPSLYEQNLPPYDYIVLVTKNTPDIPPSITSLVSSALPPSNTHTAIVLIQNGLNIEKPFISAFPTTPVLSGVSLIGSAEPAPGKIVQDDKDRLLIGAFHNPNISDDVSEKAGREFVRIYGAGGKTECVYSENVVHDRWRKLVYNACLNPICAITGLDTGRIRLADGALDGLVRPAMREIVTAARKKGVEFAQGDSIAEVMIEIDPLEIYLSPSMLADVRKGNFIEYENLLGEPLREGTMDGVPMPTLQVLYEIAKAIQWRTKEARGLLTVPPKKKQ